MQRLIVRWVVNALALYVSVIVLQQFNGISAIGLTALGYLGLAIVFTLVNALVRPILQLLTCPVILLTFGLFTLVINGLVYWITGSIGQSLGIGFELAGGFWQRVGWAILGGLVVGLVNAAMTLILREELKRG